MTGEPTIETIRQAHARIRPHIHRTPVLTSSALNQMCSAEIFFKCENFQKAGAFKIRGAANAVFSLSDNQAKTGVATHSSGNFAAALALAARSRGIRAYVVMPTSTPTVKKAAVEGYGASITFCEATLEAREKGVAGLIDRTGAAFVHPYNDYRIIAGQGTAALELVEEAPELDIVIAPVGGGGLISGTAIAVRSVSPKTLIMAAEPKMADDAYRSFKAGKIIPSNNPKTISDGLRTSLGDLTFPIIMKRVSDIVTVSEQETVDAMRHIWERMKIIVEPSASVGFAAVLARRCELAGKKIGIILSGGNVDLTDLPWK
jgi:threonine dehydratase